MAFCGVKHVITGGTSLGCLFTGFMYSGSAARSREYLRDVPLNPEYAVERLMDVHSSDRKFAEELRADLIKMDTTTWAKIAAEYDKKASKVIPPSKYLGAIGVVCTLGMAASQKRKTPKPTSKPK